AAWYVPGPLCGTFTFSTLFALRFACNFAGLTLVFAAVVGSMLIDGAGATGAIEVGEVEGIPVNGSATWAMRSVSVSTVGTAREHNPKRPRTMIPAISRIALRRR